MIPVDCPVCKKGMARTHISTYSTLVAGASLYDDSGKMIPCDPNITTYVYKCNYCQASYEAKEQYGKVIE